MWDIMSCHGALSVVVCASHTCVQDQALKGAVTHVRVLGKDKVTLTCDVKCKAHTTRLSGLSATKSPWMPDIINRDDYAHRLQALAHKVVLKATTA